MRPRAARDLQKGGSLLPAFQGCLGTCAEGARQLDQLIELRPCAVPARIAPYVHEQNRVYPPAASRDSGLDIVEQILQPADGLCFDGPFESVAVAERSGGVRRRDPGQQPVQGSVPDFEKEALRRTAALGGEV